MVVSGDVNAAACLQNIIAADTCLSPLSKAK